MVSHLFFYQLMLITLVWLFVMLHYAWPNDRTARQNPPVPFPPRRNCSKEPKPFAGLTQKPHCAACEHDALHPKPPSPVSRPDASNEPTPSAY